MNPTRPIPALLLLFACANLFGPVVHAQDGDGIDLEKGREFWAFKKPQAAAVPEVADADWRGSAIDRFVFAKLDSEGKPAPEEASRETLIRRSYFALHGLPPTPDQLREFLDDSSGDAYEKLVDQLLASPHFGERWGRHWLDVVRFAESTGGGRTMLLEHSWRYRDYVVEAFNRDKPYDRFVLEQLAGDLLEDTDPMRKRDNLIATTFLALGPSNYELQDKELLTMEIVDEQVDTVGRTFMAMTLGCARCHDHMFDPISARDYYALAGIFKSTQTVNHSNVSKWLTVDLPAISPEEKQAAEKLVEHQAKIAETNKAIKAAEKELAELQDPTIAAGIVVDDADADAVERKGNWVDSVSVPKWVGAGYVHDDAANRKPGQEDLRTISFKAQLPEDGAYRVRVAYSASTNRSSKAEVTVRHAKGAKIAHINQRKKPKVGGLFADLGEFEFSAGENIVTISNAGADGVTIADAVQWLPVGEKIAKDETGTQRSALQKQISQLKGELKKLTKSAPKKVGKNQTMTVRDAKKPGDVHLAIRGDVHKPGELVPRGIPEVMQIGYKPTFSKTESGRLELARWLTQPDHPLTARVMANRIWTKLNGEGLVRTPDNFGITGEAPTDPELLDWLALRLIEHDWSVKKLVREIMLSQTFRAARPAPQRLDAESLRDAMLLVGGKLDQKIGGPAIKPGTRSEIGYKFESDRRSLYLPVFRNALPDIFSAFDFPDPNLVAGKRNSSTLATQALYFMNHPFVVEQAKRAAANLLAESITDVGQPNPDPDQLINLAYLKSLGRAPSASEQQLAQEFLGDAPGETELAGLFQSLFACIDFRYVE